MKKIIVAMVLFLTSIFSVTYSLSCGPTPTFADYYNNNAHVFYGVLERIEGFSGFDYNKYIEEQETRARTDFEKIQGSGSFENTTYEEFKKFLSPFDSRRNLPTGTYKLYFKNTGNIKGNLDSSVILERTVSGFEKTWGGICVPNNIGEEYVIMTNGKSLFGGPCGSCGYWNIDVAKKYIEENGGIKGLKNYGHQKRLEKALQKSRIQKKQKIKDKVQNITNKFQTTGFQKMLILYVIIILWFIRKRKKKNSTSSSTNTE